MKTLSVKQVADVLNVSPRAVLKRLSNGQLKGTRRTNKFGVEEWWVYPNKEIRSSLEAAGRLDMLSSQDSADAEVVDVETQNFAPDADELDEDDDTASAQTSPDTSTGNGRGAANGIAEELWNNIISRFLGELQERDQLIGEMRSDLADKDRQLKLLPDLEKKAQEAEAERKRVEEFRLKAEAEEKRAEEERKNAELKALEADALRKQIAALQEVPVIEKQKAEELEALKEQIASLEKERERLPAELAKQFQEEQAAREAELSRVRDELETERQAKESELALLKEQLAAIDEYKLSAEEAQKEMEELKRQQAEKEAQTAAIQDQLAALTQRLEKSERPWWKKFFGIES